MQTCTPLTLSLLTPNSFQFGITKIPDVSFNLTKVNLPSVSLPTAEQSTPFSRAFNPGDLADFEQLSITFNVDVEMKNYKAIFNWLYSLAFPESYEDYIDLGEGSNILSEMSDASLVINDNHNNATIVVDFKDIFPTSIGDLQFSTTESDINYIECTCSFAVGRFKLMRK